MVKDKYGKRLQRFLYYKLLNLSQQNLSIQKKI